MKRIRAIAQILLLPLLATGCGGFLTTDQAARQHYLLEPHTGYTAADRTEVWPALVITVSAVPGLDTDHIQALGADARLVQYANARWADFLPEVLTSNLRRSLASTGRFEAVKTTGGHDTKHWSIELEVQKFYGILDTADGTVSVNARFDGSVYCQDQEHPLQLNASRPVHGERLALVVRAHQQALDDTSSQLLEQVIEACQ